MTPPPGMRHFAIVRNIDPGVRMRVFVTNAKHATTDVPEDLTAAIFDALAPPNFHEVEASFRAAFPKEGGAA
jgi:hypothetical protein